MLVILLFFALLVPLTSTSAELTVKKLDTERFSLTIQSSSFSENHTLHHIEDAVRDSTFKTSTIQIEGEDITLFYPNQPIHAAILPDETIGLAFLDNKQAIIPITNYSFSTYNNRLILCAPEEQSALMIDSYTNISAIDLAYNSTFMQTIQKLGSYDTSLLFDQSHINALQYIIEAVFIDWGDGTQTHYSSLEECYQHTYSASTDYDQRIVLTDRFGYTYEIERTYEVEYEGHVLHAALLVSEYQLPISILGVSLAGITLPLLTETWLYLFSAFCVSILPLYTRLDKEDVLDQFVRGQIYGYIKTNPGAHYNQIRREIDVKNGTLAYHLRVLEKTELIKSRKEGVRYRAFYPVGHKFPKKERFRLTNLQYRILKTIEKNEGLTQKDISAHLQKKPQTINYNIKVLQKAGLIELKRIGRKSRCYVVEENQDPETDNPALV